MLEQAIEWKLILRNPADLLKRKLPKVSEAERRVLNEIEAAAFLKACNEKPHGLIFEFALLSGMRPEEYLALQWRDLNFERNTAQVRRALVRHKKVWRFQEPKTKGSKRSVTIPASLSRKLAIHKRVQAEQRLRSGMSGKRTVSCSVVSSELRYRFLTLHTATSDRYWKERDSLRFGCMI